MLCLTAKAHINITHLYPSGLVTEDTVHLISCQQMAGSLIVPITHQHQFQAGTVISASDNRWGMRRYVWSEVKEEKRKPSSQIRQVFSKINLSHSNSKTQVDIPLVPKDFTKYSRLFKHVPFYTFGKQDVRKSNSESKAGKPHLVEVRFLICFTERKPSSNGNSKKGWAQYYWLKTSSLGLRDQ